MLKGWRARRALRQSWQLGGGVSAEPDRTQRRRYGYSDQSVYDVGHGSRDRARESWRKRRKRAKKRREESVKACTSVQDGKHCGRHTHQVWNSRNPLIPCGHVHSGIPRFEVHNPPSGIVLRRKYSTQHRESGTP
jgi:hypothetical protein